MKNVIPILIVLFFACSNKLNNKQVEHGKSLYEMINVFEDGKKVISFTYDKQESILLETRLYNIENGKIENISKYNYNNGKFKFVSQNNIKDIDYTQEVLDNIYQVKYLKDKGFCFKHPEIIESEIRDLSTVFTVADNYDDFKKSNTVVGNLRIIKFNGFNKNIRFYPSEIEDFIYHDTIIDNYSVWIDKGLVSKELYEFKSGSLERIYKYDKGNLLQVVYSSKSDNGRNNYLRVKKFTYK